MITKNGIIEHLGKATVTGTVIVFLSNIICLAFGYALLQDRGKAQITEILTLLLGIVAIADISAGFFVKKKLLEPLFSNKRSQAEDLLRQIIFKTSVVISLLCAAPPIYGLVLSILGAKIEVVIGFSVVSFVGFMLLRLRPGDFKNLPRVH